MIFRDSILIQELSDYQKILKYVDAQYVDPDLIQKLSRHLGLQCKKVIVEYPYYDSDYLSSYYIFYAQKLQKFPKECYRILFYHDKTCRKLMGYITLRPTYEGRRLGKMFFHPRYLVKEQVHMILSKCKCHTGGSEIVFEFFPHMQQEGDVDVCAHIATWSVLRSYAWRFHKYPELTLGKIVEMVSPESERMIPSRGLTVFQVSQIFRDSGFSPVVLFKDEKNPRLIIDALMSYIDSGIPVVAVLTKWRHALSVVGLGASLLQETVDLNHLIENHCPFESYQDHGNDVMTQVVLSSRFYRSVVVNDDNYFPYSPVHTKLQEHSENEERVPYTISEIDRIIIPLYARIQLTYEDVRTIFLRLVAANPTQWGDTTIGRIFLTSANTYREYVNESCGELNPLIKKILISLEMPRFIWCVEVSKPEHYQLSEPVVDGLLILDSTSATFNPEPFLFIADMTGIVCFKNHSDIIKWSCQDDTGFPIPRFAKNLKEVN